MPFIQTGKNMDDITEESTVPGDNEYDLKIVDVAEPSESKSGRTMVRTMLKVEDPDFSDSQPIFHYLVFPKEEDWEAENGRTGKLLLRNIKRFCDVFDINYTDEGFSTEELSGATGRCLVVDDEYEGTIKNILRLPRSRNA